MTWSCPSRRLTHRRFGWRSRRPAWALWTPCSLVASISYDRTRRWRPAIVSFSGVDGSGKSTQAAGLRDTLRELGIRADVQWAGVKTGSRLRALLPLLDGPSGSVSPVPATDPPDPLIPGVLRNSSLGRHLWLGHVVAVNVASLWGHVAHGRQTARVLIFDEEPAVRGALDARCGWIGMRSTWRPTAARRSTAWPTPSSTRSCSTSRCPASTGSRSVAGCVTPAIARRC